MTLDFQIIIDKEYQDLIPPLSTKDHDELKDSIREKGLLKPITLNEKRIIIDGHHRYKICQELGIIPTFVIKHFESEIEEIEYINDCNIKRRHLNPFQRIAIALKTKHKLEEIAKRNRAANLPNANSKSESPSDKCLSLGRVNENLGKSASSSYETVRKVEKILKEAPQVIIDKANKGQYSINKAFKHLQNEQRKLELLNAPTVVRLPENTNYKLLQGDLLEKGEEIPDNSIDLILTDPPYEEASLPLYSKLGELAIRVLKPGGSLVSLVGHYALIRSANLIQESGLKYIHIMAVIHGGGSSMLYPYHIRVKWKPALWYVKGTKPNTASIIEDLIYSSPPDKSLHP